MINQHLIPKLGKVLLTELRPDHLQNYYSHLLIDGRCGTSTGLSARTVKHHHTMMHKALQTALEWGLVSRNVADAVKPPRARRPDMLTWSEPEIIRFLEAAKSTPYYAMFHTVLFTGMRRSEFLALKWSDVDFIYSQLHVNRGLHHLRDGSYVFTEPKAAKSRRTIALTPSTALILRGHREKQEALRAMLGARLTDDDLIFSLPDGKPHRPNTITRAWTILAAQCGVKVIRLHDARHTHASLMLKQGVHPKIVQERLGHATISITLDTYSHVAPGLQEAAAAGFDNMLYPTREEANVEAIG